MTLYSYKAKDKDDNEYAGTFEAATRVDLYNHIRDEGGRVISVHEAKKGSLTLSNFLGASFGSIGTHDKILFARNLGAMITAGLSVTRALGVMEKQTKNKKLKDLLHDLIEDVSRGETLSDAMKRRPKIFSSLFASMVKAGEESGNMASSLSIVASQMDKSYTLQKKVRGAMIYPSIILSVMIVIAILMLIYMVPTLTATFKDVGATLPLSTRIIIATSHFLVTNTLLVIAALVIFVSGLITLWKSQAGQRFLDSLTIHLPGIGTMVKEINSARTARTLSSLLSSGVDIVVALEVTRDTLQNHLYSQVLDHIHAVIQKGEQMSVTFSKYDHLFPPFVSEMVAVGEETGKISEMLIGVANYYEEEVDERTKDLSTIIEPLLMVIIGAGVGVFAISMLAPTYSLVNNI